MTSLLYISTARLPGEKANSYQVLQMCRSFANMGIDVTLLYPARKNTPEMLAVKDLQSYYDLDINFRLEKLSVMDLIYPSTRIMKRTGIHLTTIQDLAFRLMMFTYSKSVLQYLEVHKADRYYARSPYLAEVLLKRKVELVPRLFLEIHSFPKKTSIQQKEANLLKQIGGAITITHHLKDRYMQSGVPDDRILVAPDGVNISYFKERMTSQAQARTELKFPKDGILIGYVGRLDTMGLEKGIPTAIQAVSIIRKKSTEFKPILCCVGGPTDLIDSYTEYAINKGLSSEQVIFIGQVPPKDIPRYLSAFDICVMPHPLNEFFAYYISPLKLFEYMISERPIISSKLPSIEEILAHKQNAYLVPPGDPLELAEGIVWLISNPEISRSLASKARQDVEAYDWEKRAENIVSFMQSCP